MGNEDLYQGINLGKERKERLKHFAEHNHMKMVGVICRALDDLIPVQLDPESLIDNHVKKEGWGKK